MRRRRVHLVGKGLGTACNRTLPVHENVVVNPRLVTCVVCRRTLPKKKRGHVSLSPRAMRQLTDLAKRAKQSKAAVLHELVRRRLRELASYEEGYKRLRVIRKNIDEIADRTKARRKRLDAIEKGKGFV